MGFGLVRRNSNGNFIAAKGLTLNGLYTPKEAEAIGVREALCWLKQLKLDHVIIEMDALQLFRGIQSGSLSCSKYLLY